MQETFKDAEMDRLYQRAMKKTEVFIKGLE